MNAQTRSAAASITPLRQFVVEMTRLVEATDDEQRLLGEGRPLLARLVSRDDWLPDAFAQPHPDFYQQYLLHADPFERFCVVSFVWGPGQKTPIHDHTVWGLVGILRGAERAVRYGRDEHGALVAEGEDILPTGAVEAVSPDIGDIHAVENAVADRPSISIHVYGGNIGAIRRSVFDPQTGERRPFVSGYSSPAVPNLWDRSAEVRAATC
ncbi:MULTISPECIES: cysteine dioxygenase family protein [unclassified Xanthobacter]|uniref:cysteine dioxygenase family protein n=1 Tax=unclassified Xanthobacter TaxID=2623496 RepID=UPI001EDF635A|nr:MULTISPECIES: cysteine dioxygenase [unclassified Xanthobacter]